MSTEKILKGRIARRLVFAVVIFSLLITLVLTIFQVYLEYKKELDHIQTDLDLIQTSYLQSLTNSVWVYNDKQVLVQLEGILGLPKMEYAEIRVDEKTFWSVGIRQSKQTINKDFSLTQRQKNNDISIGVLHVIVSLDVVYQALTNRAVTILINNGIMIFLIAGFILLIFHNLIAKHLASLARQLSAIDITQQRVPLTLSRPSSQQKGSPDELEQVLTAFNEMQHRLAHAFDGLHQYEHIVSSSSDMLALLDTQFTYLAVNKMYREAFKLTREQLIGNTAAAVFGEEFFNTVIKPNAERCLAGEEVNFQDWFDFPAYGRCYMDINYYPYFSEDNKIIGFVVNGRNITDRKQAEEIKRKLEEQIQHTQKMESLGVLAGGIAHDFNNILMGIMGNISLAQMKMSPETIGIEHLSDIEVAAKRAAELTNQMLAYSGKGQFIIKALDLSAVVEEMTHLVKSSISKDVVLKLDLADDLPSIEGDPTQIRQVIMNLITNASDAVTKTSGIVTITTGAIMCDSSYLSQLYSGEELQEGRYVHMEVSDTGSGMDKETIEKIFDPFFSTKDDGRGLGLSAVLGIIRGHKGGIKVYSEPGRGTTFKVLFPASAKDAEEFTEDSIEHEGYVGEGTILVVDDEESVLDIASSMLKEFGFDVLTASDGQDALEVFRDNADEISLILMDLTMPRMGGIAAFRNLRQIDKDVKIILSSGYNEQDAVSTLAGKGLAEFIQKPYRMEQLISKIRKVLGDV